MLFFLLLIVSFVSTQQQNPPIYIPAVSTRSVNGNCPTIETRQATRDLIQESVETVLLSDVIPLLLNRSSPCSCGGPGVWRRIAHLNMSDPSQQCPDDWNLITAPVRACGRSTEAGSCDSAIFQSGSEPYSQVCGRILAYQSHSPSAFQPSLEGHNPGLEGVYIEGVSLTHGVIGSRQHIWSFANALFESDAFIDYRAHSCPCVFSDQNWPYQIPSFVGSDYFCDSGNPGPGFGEFYTSNLLWDGEGCGATNTCCQFNTPPWFCTTLPQPTSDDLEVRICADQQPMDEDALVSLIDIYVF